MKTRLLIVGSLMLSTSVAFASGAPVPEGHIPWGDIVKQGINFAILFSVLIYFLKTPLSKFLQERSEMMKKSIEAAAVARKEAAAKLAEIDAKMAGLSAELGKLTQTMDAEAGVEAVRLAETAKVEMERIRQQAKFSADQELRKAKEELRAEASELAIKAAEEVVRKSVTPADQERLVKENIEKIREMAK